MRERRWKLVALLASGIVIGVALAGTPAAAHVGGTVGHLWSHLRPWADARYDRPTVEPGETIRGTIGGQVLSTATSTEWGFNAQLPRAAPVALDDAHVVINGVPADEPTPVCTGTAANPTASPGYVCIYPYSTGSMNGLAGSIWGTGTNKWGFQVSINASAIGEVYWFANWAYRAPTS